MNGRAASPLVAGLVLASASPRRADILREAGFVFAIDAADIDEESIADGNSPAGVASQLALAKAEAVSSGHRGSVVLGADTVVEIDGELIGKPLDAADARALLQRLAGREHRVTSGVAVVTESQSVVDTETTIVKMRAYTRSEIDGYVESGLPLDKAGAYGIQDRPFSPAESIVGCYLNVVGLPLCLTSRLLRGAEALAADHDVACYSHDLAGASA